MTINKILNSLENSWERDIILTKIKNGLGTEDIVNEFLLNNKVQVKELNNLLKPEDKDLLNQVEQLSICEAQLIKKIINFNSFENKEDYQLLNDEKISKATNSPSHRISLFMINWSNKFVVTALLIISAIALSKQAWA